MRVPEYKELSNLCSLDILSELENNWKRRKIKSQGTNAV